MAGRVPARLTAAEGRRFGTTVGGAFLVLAGLSWWRGHPTVFAVLGLLGGTLILGGLVIPTAMGPVERAWMGLARVLSRITTPVVMGAMYLLAFSTVGILRRTAAGSPLVHKETSAGFWKQRPAGSRRSKDMRRQF